MMQSPDNSRHTIKYQYKEILFGTCLLFNTILLQVLTSLNTSDKFTTIAVATISISLPTLSCALFVMLHYRVVTNIIDLLGTVGIFSTIVGTSFFFFHFSPLIGLIFLFTLLLCIWISQYHISTLKPTDHDKSISPRQDIKLVGALHALEQTQTESYQRREEHDQPGRPFPDDQ
jgi:hypothetical protein